MKNQNYVKAILLLMLFFSQKAFSQLSGTFTIPGSYSSIANAVTALNTNGVGAGGATFNVAAGYTETITGTIVLSATGTASNPIIFQKSGSGANPLITSYTGTQTNSATPDGMWAIAGGDYITIDGINLLDKVANTTATTTMEYGYGLFKLSGTDGAQNNTIKNCVVTLNRANNAAWLTVGGNGSIGITVNNSTYNASSTNITVTAASGSNSYNKFYSNTIQNCNAGMVFHGFAAASPYNLADTLNDVGGSSLATGNTIINFGGATSATNAAVGVNVRDQWGFNLSYNTINNNNGSGVNHVSTIRGIFTTASSINASMNINYNTLTIKGGGTTSQVSVIENNGGITGTNNTINIIGNNVLNCEYLTATSGVFYGIYNLATATNVNINNNTVNGINYSASALTGSGAVYGIFYTSINTSASISQNVIKNITRTGNTGGTSAGIFSTGAVVNYIISQNNIDSLTINGTGSGGIIHGIQSSGTTTTLEYNNISNLRNTKTTGTGLIYGLSNPNTNTNEYIRYNNIFNITHNGTGIVYGHYAAGAGNKFISYNNFYNLTSTGLIAGISIASGTVNIFNNKIYDVTTNTALATAISASGITIGSLTSGGTHNLYNNLISRIYAPSANGGTNVNVFGINITNTTTNTNIKVYNNTVNIDATSTGTNFSTTSISTQSSATSTSGNVELRNNIFVNTSTPRGTGIVSVLRRSAATSLVNLNINSDRNLYFTGATFTNRCLFSDGTTQINNIGSLQTTLSPREANSISEDPNFLSNIGNNSNYLKINPSISTNIESGGRNVSPVSFDFANVVRAGNNGYTGLGGAPDLGAFEGDYTANAANNMTFDSTTADQVTGNVPLGSSDVRVLRLRIHSSKATNALAVTSFEFNTGGSSNPSLDFSNAKVYFTNGDSSFSTSQLFGSVSSPNGTFTINGNKKLGTGVNYFWLTYDIASSANGGDVVDAMFNSVVVDAITRTPLNGDPIGNRNLQSPLNGNYYLGTGQTAPNYPTITDALTDLNALGVSGPVTFILTDSVYSSNSSITLTNFRGASATNIVTFVPNTGVAARIECTGIAPTIDLNAAKYFVFDGRQGGVGSFVSGNSLVIRNTTTLAPAIRFVNDSKFNRISYCDLQSNNQNNAGTTVSAGVVYFGTTTVGGLGNDSNTVNYCDIHENTAVSGTPLYGINSGGSTALAATNDNNIIDNNNIYNFIDASGIGTPGSGINLGLSNAYWTISNNHLYQTSARAYLGTGINRALYILTNTGAGFTITNNFIGGSASDGTGTYTITNLPTSTTAQYILMDVSVAGGNGIVASSIQGNTISNINITGGQNSAQTGASIFSCIGIRVQAGNVNLGTVTGNIIGSRTVNGAITFNGNSTTANSGGFAGINIASSLANSTINVSNNIISGITAGGTYGSEIYGIDVTNGVSTMTTNVTNNMIGDTTLANSILLNNNTTVAGGSSRILGLYLNLASAATVNFNNNIIANLTSNNTGATTKGILVSAPTAGGTYNVNNNLIYNLISSSTSTATGGGAGLNGIVMGNFTSAGANTTCNGNKIHTLISKATNAAVSITGLVYRTTKTGTNIANGNLIHGLYSATQNDAALITGIDISDGTASTINNIIRLGLDSNGTSIVGAPTLIGIAKTGATATGNISNILFNTVYIGGTVDNSLYADTNRTYAFFRNGTGADTVVNNIFYNIRTNSTATVARNFGTALSANSGLIMDYNLLKGDSIGIYGANSYYTMPSWKSGSSVDANSVSSTMDFINATGDKNSIDLHINASIATAVEAYGIAVNGIGTTTDYDGQTRSGLTPHDLGADAGNFIAKDVAAPSISYTAIPSDQFTNDRTITANITDATGVYLTGAFSPRVYFKKYTSGTWYSNVGSLTAGSATSGTWQFTVSASTMGGLVATDTVYYFVTAQDITSSNNLGSYPGGIEGSDVNSISTYPTPFVFNIKPLISGVYTVGSGSTFANLTGAGGFFDFINNSVMSGNVIANITSDIEEPGTIELNQLTQAGSGGFTLTISPDAANLRVLSGNVTTANSALIRLNGADRVIIDGSYNNSGKYLRIMNRATTAGTINLFNDAKFNTIANCYIQGVNASTTLGILNFVSEALNGTGNDSNTINACIFSDTTGSAMTNTTGTNKPSVGVGSVTFNALTGNDGITVSNCEFKNIRFYDINITTTGGNYWNIYNNSIYADNDSSFVQTYFIYVQGGGGHSIRKNSMGGSAPDRSGAPYIFRANSFIKPLFLASASTIPTTIDSNTFGNMSSQGSPGGSGINYIMHISAANATTIVKNNIIGGAFNPWDTIVANGSLYGSYISAPCTYTNNIIGNLYTKTGTTGYVAGINIGTISGTANFTDNIVRDITHPNSTVSYGAQGPIGIYLLPGSTDIVNVERNTIYNISAFTGGLIARGIQVGISGSNVVKINANKIYNITVNVPGAITPTNSAAYAAGITTSSSGINTYTNNQISIGEGSNRRVIGYLNTSTANANYFYNNSIFINGVGDTTSYGIYNQGAGTIDAVNNLIYNKRTGNRNVTKNFAIGSSTVALNSNTQKYNSFVLNDSAQVYEIGTNPLGWTSFNNLYSSVYNTNWLGSTNTVLADSLFTDTINNLSIKASNPESWYVNGKGIALGNVTSDFNGNSRSTSITGGSTDIGAIEFNTNSTPPSAIESAAPVTGTTTTYSFANRQIASIEWGPNGTVPTSVDIKHYTGNVSPSLNTAMKAYNGYYAISQIGGVGFDYNVTLSYDSAMFGNIPRFNQTKLATFNSGSWSKLAASTPNNVSGQLAGNTILGANTLPAIFTVSDTTTIPPSNVNFTINAFLQGLYLGSGVMTAAPFNADGISPTNIADTITVELRDPSNQSLSYSAIVLLGTNGTCNVSLPAATNGNSYYIVLVHRNSIATWSATPVTMAANGSSYNFTNSASQAAGSNLADLGSGIFGIYAGDINQDGSIDFNDYPALDIASSAGVLGYDANDLNGDASVDFNDYPMIDINSSNGIIVATP